jgi:hypothetical protein
MDRVAKVPAQQVGEVVPEDGSDRAEEDDEREADLALACEDAAGDHGRLAREEGDDRVEEGEREDDQVRPRGARDQVDELIEHAVVLQGLRVSQRLA